MISSSKLVPVWQVYFQPLIIILKRNQNMFRAFGNQFYKVHFSPHKKGNRSILGSTKNGENSNRRTALKPWLGFFFFFWAKICAQTFENLFTHL